MGDINLEVYISIVEKGGQTATQGYCSGGHLASLAAIVALALTSNYEKQPQLPLRLIQNSVQTAHKSIEWDSRSNNSRLLVLFASGCCVSADVVYTKLPIDQRDDV